MKLGSRNMLVSVAGLAALSILVGACASDAAEAPSAEEADHIDEDEHRDEDEHMHEDEHIDDDLDMDMEGMNHGVPEEARQVPNPFAADEDSPALGAEIFATNCATCHGATGEGDGPASLGIAMPPADLHEAHVQGNSDGALFYIITHGSPDTPMPAWESVLTEEQRWHLVNFLRTFQ